MNLKKILLKVFSVNFIQTITNIAVGFLVPAILTIGGYADLKTYTLYMTYVGLLHFGFVDGMYLKYGGKNKKNIVVGELKGEHLFLIVLQLIITILFLISAILFHNKLLLLISISILPTNLVNYHKQYYQAIGNFDFYAKLMNIYSFCYALFNLLLIFVFNISSFEWYCLVTFMCNLTVLFVAEYRFYKITNGVKIIITKDIFDNIKSGFFLMMGNLVAIFLFAIDKWFVKLFFTTDEFSYYSFAVSMYNIIIVFLNSICIVFYNVFSKEHNQKYIIKIKEKMLILGSFSSNAYYALAFFVNLILPKYIPSLSIIAYSFATFPYLFVIKAVYVNLYKSSKQEKKYTKVVFIMLVLAIMLNMISMLIFESVYLIACATLLTFIIWYIFSFKDFKYLKSDLRECLYLLITTISFIICSHFVNIYVGFIINNLILIVNIRIIFSKKFCDIIK